MKLKHGVIIVVKRYIYVQFYIRLFQNILVLCFLFFLTATTNGLPNTTGETNEKE